MTYLPPDIMDNDDNTLAQALARAISEVGQRRLYERVSKGADIR
jgi:hypothetical protein